jgi:hypothetical protein
MRNRTLVIVLCVEYRVFTVLLHVVNIFQP